MKSSSLFPWVVWGICALFFCFGFFARVAPSVMIGELMRDFNVGAAVLGNLSAFYFYAYAGLQLPLGVMLDRWPERILMAGIVLCGCGCLVFGMAPSLGMAYAGRFLIGAGAAAAWIGTMKLVSMWFPANLFARINGLTAMLGMAGAVGGQAPLAVAVEAAGWRGTMIGGAAFAALLAIGVWLILGRRRAPVPARVGAGAGAMLGHLATVVRTPQTWIAAIVIAIVIVPLLVFTGLWGVPYLMVAHGLERPVAAASTSLYLIGWGIGAPLLGWLSDRAGRYRMPMLIGMFVSFASLLALIYAPGVSLLSVQVLLFVSGFAGGAGVIAFASARAHNRPGAAGAMAGTVNMATMSLSAVLQPFVGWILDTQWDGRMEAGARIYSVEAYHVAFIGLAVCGVLSVGSCLFIRDTP